MAASIVKELERLNLGIAVADAPAPAPTAAMDTDGLEALFRRIAALRKAISELDRAVEEYPPEVVELVRAWMATNGDRKSVEAIFKRSGPSPRE